MSDRDLMTAVLDALNRGDLNGFLDLTDPEVEFNSLIAEADTGTFHGHEGIREWWETVQESLGGLSFSPEEMREIPDLDDVILVKLRVAGEVRGVKVEQVMWQAARRRGDKAVWWQIGRTEDEVVEAARRAASGE